MPLKEIKGRPKGYGITKEEFFDIYCKNPKILKEEFAELWRKLKLDDKIILYIALYQKK